MSFTPALPTLWLTRLGWAVGAMLAVWVLLWLAVPPLAKREIEHHGTAALGSAVALGSAHVTDNLPSGARQHQLRTLDVSVPFLSDFQYRRTAQIQPQLSFELNGSRFDAALQGTPFDTSHKMEARLKVPRFNMAPWLPYVPADLVIRPSAGVLDADLRIAFADAPQASVMVSGHLGASGLVLNDAAGAEVSRTDAVAAELEDVRPLERVATPASLTLEAPALQWVRKRAGRLRVELLDAPVSSNATKTVAAYAYPPAVAWQFDAQSPARIDVWKLASHALHIQHGQFRFTDGNFKPAALVALAEPWVGK